MLKTYYLVTVADMKKKTHVQYLINGDFKDAQILMGMIATRTYRRKVKYMSCTITEIMSDKINVYFWGEESRTFSRKLDEDTYLLHFYPYMIKDKKYITCVKCIAPIELKEFFPSENGDNIIDPDECGMDAVRSFQTFNRINFREVSLVDFDDNGDEEGSTKIEFVKTSHCPCCGGLEVDEKFKVIKLKT